MDGRILEGLIDTYNFLMKGHQTEMCSFVDNWGFCDLIRYNIIDYIYWFGICLLIFSYRFIRYIAPTLQETDIYKRYKPIGEKIYRETVRYIVFS